MELTLWQMILYGVLTLTLGAILSVSIGLWLWKTQFSKRGAPVVTEYAQKAFFEGLEKAAGDPNSQERKAIEKFGGVLIGIMSPAIKSQMRKELGDFVNKLYEPPKEHTTKDGEVILEFNNEQKWMHNMLAQGVNFGLMMIPEIIPKDGSNYKLSDEMKYFLEAAQYFFVKQFTFIMNKMKGQFEEVASNIPQELLNNPEILSSIADGGLQNVDVDKFVPLIGEKNAGKVQGLIDAAPALIRIWNMFKMFQGGPGIPGGQAANTGTSIAAGSIPKHF